jgi:hypothetical protein
MEDVKIILTTLWVATMLTYLLGDVMRIFAGDFVAGEMEGVQVTQVLWLGIAGLFVRARLLARTTFYQGHIRHYKWLIQLK